MDCYNEKTHMCDLSCQGACNCPIAQGLNPSVRVMKLYVRKQKESEKAFNEFMKREDVQKIIQKFSVSQ